jgi:hypothetical protein
VAAVSVACTSARSVPCASALSSPARLKVASPAPSPHRRGGVDYLAEGFLSFRAGSRELHERLSERCSTLFFPPPLPRGYNTLLLASLHRACEDIDLDCQGESLPCLTCRKAQRQS